MIETLTPDAAVVAALSAAGRAESAATAATLRLAARLVADRRRGCDPDSAAFAPVEVGVALGISTHAARLVVVHGEQLRDDFPGFGRALACGDLTWVVCRTLLERLAHLGGPAVDPQVRARVEAQVLDRVVGRCLTAGAAGAACDRVLTAVDPALLRERARRAAGDREVRVYPEGDGMAGIHGLLPADDGRAVDARLDELAAQPCALDPRSVAQRRADALVAVMAGHRRLRCTCGSEGCDRTAEVVDLSHPARGPRTEVHVVVPAETLLGAGDLPGVLRRMGVVDADTVRRLAADATWRKLLTLDDTPVHLGRPHPAGVIPDPPDQTDVTGPTSPTGAADGPGDERQDGCGTGPGALPSGLAESTIPLVFRRPDLDTSTGPELCVDAPDPATDPSVLRYTPCPALAKLVRDRDGHCRFPGCTVPAGGCDLDHVIPYDHDHPLGGGWTVRTNLAALCRHHHNAKTRGVWTVRMDPDGTQHWTGPTGQHATTTPDGLPPRPGEHGPPLPADGRPGVEPLTPRVHPHGELSGALEHALLNHLDLEALDHDRRQWHDRDHPPATPPRRPRPPDDDPPPFLTRAGECPGARFSPAGRGRASRR